MKKGTVLLRYMTAENITSMELGVAVVRELDKIPTLLKSDMVVIEYQPKKAREKMKVLPKLISSYYIIRGIVDSEKPTIKLITEIDARNKLTVYDGPVIHCNLKNPYDRNKYYGIKYCEYFIAQNSQLKSHFSSFSKQDDLADCFLQGLWWLKYGQHGKHAPPNEPTQKKIHN